MSRIYEALQKAESERKLERRERESLSPEPLAAEMELPTAVAEVEYEPAAIPPVAAIPPAAVIPPAAEVPRFTAIPPAAAVPSFAAIPPAATAPPPFAAIPPEPGPVRAVEQGIDPSTIVKGPWTLAVDQLPALLERGPAVEQFRSLRSRIYELRDIKPLKSILVSSGMPQEGKSFIATNLAVSLARHKNSKVLLIDGDMRRYTVHQILGCESQPGLAEYLAGKASLMDVMQRAEVSVDANSPFHALIQNLTFIAGGNGGDKAADLSGNPRFGELIRQVSPHFDWIIVDSSPVIPVSDAVNLARSCDGVLLVARGGVTQFAVAQRAQSELKASNILGFVLNAVAEVPQVTSYYAYDANKE